MTTTLSAPQILDMPADEYHRRTELSSTGARRLLPPSTPAKFAYLADHEEPPTRAMQIGTAAHSLILGKGAQPVLVDAEEWRSNAVKAEVAAHVAAGRVPVKPSEWRQITGMAKAIGEHPVAGPLLAAGSGVAERAVFWSDPETGTRCRALLDWTPNNGRSVVDLKTTGDVAPAGLGRLFAAHGYPIQAAWYLDAARAVGLAGSETPFIFVFVSREPPHEVVIADCDRDDLAWAHEQCRIARQIHRDCTESGIWPSHPTEPITVRMPPWARRDPQETW